MSSSKNTSSCWILSKRYFSSNIEGSLRFSKSSTIISSRFCWRFAWFRLCYMNIYSTNLVFSWSRIYNYLKMSYIGKLKTLLFLLLFAYSLWTINLSRSVFNLNLLISSSKSWISLGVHGLLSLNSISFSGFNWSHKEHPFKHRFRYISLAPQEKQNSLLQMHFTTLHPSFYSAGTKHQGQFLVFKSCAFNIFAEFAKFDFLS